MIPELSAMKDRSKMSWTDPVEGMSDFGAGKGLSECSCASDYK